MFAVLTLSLRLLGRGSVFWHVKKPSYDLFFRKTILRPCATTGDRGVTTSWSSLDLMRFKATKPRSEIAAQSSEKISWWNDVPIRFTLFQIWDFSVELFCVTQLENFLLIALWLQRSCNALNSSCHYFVLFNVLSISFLDKFGYVWIPYNKQRQFCFLNFVLCFFFPGWRVGFTILN
jgi:hypothetical protein